MNDDTMRYHCTGKSEQSTSYNSLVGTTGRHSLYYTIGTLISKHVICCYRVYKYLLCKKLDPSQRYWSSSLVWHDVCQASDQASIAGVNGKANANTDADDNAIE